MTQPIAQDSTHWYDRAGNPVYTVKGAQGQDVTPDIRHARKLGLLPGVTGVMKVQAAPALTNWLVDQALMAALTLPRVEGETLDQFKARARQDSQQQSQNARDDGSSLHTALEMFAQQRPYESRWERHIEATYQNLLTEYGVDLVAGGAERSFAHQAGFGGKNDWHCRNQNVLLDYKSKQRIEDKKMVYDEHIQQLAACAQGLMPADRPRLLSVFVGIEDCGVLVHEWKPDDAARGWEMFKAALRLWQLKNNYDSSFSLEKAAA